MKNPRGYEVADRLRARSVKVVTGDMNVSALPEEALEHCNAVVIGEAEGSLAAAYPGYRGEHSTTAWKNFFCPDELWFPQEHL